jgi:hypothetical protein
VCSSDLSSVVQFGCTEHDWGKFAIRPDQVHLATVEKLRTRTPRTRGLGLFGEAVNEQAIVMIDPENGFLSEIPAQF